MSALGIVDRFWLLAARRAADRDRYPPVETA